MPPKKKKSGPLVPKQKKSATKRKRDNEGDDFDVIMGQETGNNTKKAPFESAKYKNKKKQKLDLKQKKKKKEENENVCVVHIRQRVPHKRTFYYLEQLILKHKIDGTYPSMQLKETSYGVDISFESVADANKFTTFIGNVLPADSRDRSSSISDNTKNFSIELVPICREDVVCFPPRLYNSLGNFGPIAICFKVTHNLYFVDPITLKIAEISPYHYFQKDKPFRPLFSSHHLQEYTVIDVEMDKKQEQNKKSKRFCSGIVQVSKTVELGDNNSICFAHCQFADQLTAGDIVYGYDMKNANLNDDNITAHKSLELPDVILIRKSYPRPKQRHWKLKHWKMELDDDYERFLEELEEDAELRAEIDLYKNPNYKQENNSESAASGNTKGAPTVSLEELLDDLSL